MVLAATAAALAWLAPAVAEACSCMQQAQDQAFREAASVFEGRVVSVEQVRPGDEVSELRAELDVVRTWKGADAERIELLTAANSAMCGFHFEVGESYLVYTHVVEGTEQVSLCSRTQLIQQAGEDLAAMGEGVTPVDPSPPVGGVEPGRSPTEPAPGARSHQAGCASCAVGAAAGGPEGRTGLLAGALLLLALAWRRRR